MSDLDLASGVDISALNCSEEVAVRIRSRRNRLLGLWAASHLRMSVVESEAYARDLVSIGVQNRSDDAVVIRISRDFADAQIGVSANAIRQELMRLTSIAALEHGARPRDVHRTAA